jgi:ribosomal protein S18 acetylase RimI-like enzyme
LREQFSGLPTPAGRYALEGEHGTDLSADVPLTEATDARLGEAVADNLHALFRAMQVLPGSDLDEADGLARHHAAPLNPMFKGAWRLRLDEQGADAAIADTLAWFQARGAPFAFWWLDPRDRPADLPARLAAHGCVPWEENAPGMVAALTDLRYDLMARVPAGFRMERVRDEAALHAFKQAFVAGLEVPEWAGQAWVDATLAAGIEQAPWQPYVGYLDGEPVASNMLFCGAGVASVFGVATAPAARGQGIGAAITLIAYQDAQALGYRYGVLFASESGLPVYRRIGFRTVGFGISRYLWRAA